MHSLVNGTHSPLTGNFLLHLDGHVVLKSIKPLAKDQLILNSLLKHFLVHQVSEENSQIVIKQAMTGHVNLRWVINLTNILSQSQILTTLLTVLFMVAIQCSLAWERINGLVLTPEVRMLTNLLQIPFTERSSQRFLPMILVSFSPE